MHRIVLHLNTLCIELLEPRSLYAKRDGLVTWESTPTMRGLVSDDGVPR